MSLLANLPHKANHQTRTVAAVSRDNLGGQAPTYTNRATGVKCWLQPASQTEITDYEKRGYSVTHKIFYAEDPTLDEGDQVVMIDPTPTALQGTFDFATKGNADAGIGVLHKVFVTKTSSGS